MTATRLADDPVLREAVKRIRAHYGERVERIVLFGSRARGDHGPESDYDVAVFLKDLDDYWAEVRVLALIEHDLLLAHGVGVVAMPFEADGPPEPRGVLRLAIQEEGIAL